MIASTTSPKANALASSRHARVIDDLQQEIAELVLELREIAALDRIRDLVGFLDRVGRDRAEVLLEVPRAAGARRAQRGHDLDQAGDVFCWFHAPQPRRSGGRGREEGSYARATARRGG